MERGQDESECVGGPAQLELPMTHLVLDEVHERDMHTDFLMLLVRHILPAHPRLRLILMSATLASTESQLLQYWSQNGTTCATISVPGRLFKVHPFFLEEALAVAAVGAVHTAALKKAEAQARFSKSTSTSTRNSQFIVPLDTVAALIVHIHQSSWRDCSAGVLVFLPGWKEIETVQRMLLEQQDLDLGRGTGGGGEPL